MYLSASYHRELFWEKTISRKHGLVFPIFRKEFYIFPLSSWICYCSSIYISSYIFLSLLTIRDEKSNSNLQIVNSKIKIDIFKRIYTYALQKTGCTHRQENRRLVGHFYDMKNRFWAVGCGLGWAVE
jgi:hypothetical protein